MLSSMNNKTLPDNPELNEKISQSYNEMIASVVKIDPVISVLAELYKPSAVATVTITVDEEDKTTVPDIQINYHLDYNPIMHGMLGTREHVLLERYIAQHIAAAHEVQSNGANQ